MSLGTSVKLGDRAVDAVIGCGIRLKRIKVKLLVPFVKPLSEKIELNLFVSIQRRRTPFVYKWPGCHLLDDWGEWASATKVRDFPKWLGIAA